MDRAALAILPFGDPFPGLRPFQTEDSLKFFGRDEQVEELLGRLASHRFVAVVGESGCGKSSLVLSGLIPALYCGFLRESTSRWRFAVMRPGTHPIERLASALVKASIGSADALESLSTSSHGLAGVVTEAGLEPGESLLVIVDQFEELFRYAESAKQAGDAAARLFVRMLLDAVSSWRAPVYVVVTMRSEFLGQCAKFPGLPEMLNRSQYLVPLLGREQREEAIVRPLRLVGATPAPALVQELLNASSKETTVLPVLQHALARTYECWRQAGESPELVRLEDYDQVGGVDQALENHGDQLLAVVDELRPMCQRMFKALTVTAKGAITRRPTLFGDLKAIVKASNEKAEKDLAALIRLFAKRRHSFLTLSTDRLSDATIVDITHESLIWFWPTLKEWVKEEARSSEWYVDLARDVIRHRGGDVSLWRDPELGRALEARQKNDWNGAWALQYVSGKEAPSFENVAEFLEKSVEAQDAARRQDEAARARAEAQQRTIRRLMGAVAALVIGLFGYFTWEFFRLSARTTENNTQTQAITEAVDAQSAALAEKQRVERELAEARAALALAQQQGTVVPDDAARRLQELTAQQAQKEQDLKKAQDAANAAVAANTAASEEQKALAQRATELQQQLETQSAALGQIQMVNTGYGRDLERKTQELEAKTAEAARLNADNAELRRRLEMVKPGASQSDVQQIREVIREYFLGFPTVTNRSTARLAAVFPAFARWDTGRIVNTLSGVDELTLAQSGDVEMTFSADRTGAEAYVMILQSTRLKGENSTTESRRVRFTLNRNGLTWTITAESRA